MSWLHYANQTGTGDWEYAHENVRRQLLPYEKFLERAIGRAESKAHALGWSLASPEDRRDLTRRSGRRVPK